jgi:branched-chain amino acid transport system substrate-binding protein
MARALSKVLPACLGLALALGCERKTDQIRIGGVAPLTGDGATFGISARRGFEMAVAEWNARGGVLGKPIKLFVADDKGDPGEGATAVMMLIHQRKVAGVVGPAMTKVSLAGAPIAQSAGIPLIASASTNLKVTQVGDFIFRACFVDPFQGSAGAGFAFHELKARKAACLFDLGNDYTAGISEVFKATFTRLGGDVAAYEGHASGTPDFRVQLTKILRTGPDLIYAPGFYGDAALITRQARELGFRGPVLGADGWDSPRLVELGGPSMENTFFTTFFSHEDPSPTVQNFVGAFKAKHGEPPDGHATMGYEAAMILLDGIRRAGTTDGRAVRDAIARTDLRLVTGRVTFDPQRNPIKPIVFMEIKGGRRMFRSTRLPDPSQAQDSTVPVPREESGMHSWR